jgi:hypothetical protein
MMPTDRDLDPLTCPPIHTLNQASRHPQSLPTAPSAEAREPASRLAVPVKAHVDLLIEQCPAPAGELWQLGVLQRRSEGVK